MNENSALNRTSSQTAVPLDDSRHSTVEEGRGHGEDRDPGGLRVGHGTAKCEVRSAEGGVRSADWDRGREEVDICPQAIAQLPPTLLCTARHGTALCDER